MGNSYYMYLILITAYSQSYSNMIGSFHLSRVKWLCEGSQCKFVIVLRRYLGTLFSWMFQSCAHKWSIRMYTVYSSCNQNASLKITVSVFAGKINIFGWHSDSMLSWCKMLNNRTESDHNTQRNWNKWQSSRYEYDIWQSLKGKWFISRPDLSDIGC